MGHESCVAWDKAYFTKGQIYQALYESPVADYKKLDSEAVEKAWEAYPPRLLSTLPFGNIL